MFTFYALLAIFLSANHASGMKVPADEMMARLDLRGLRVDSSTSDGYPKREIKAKVLERLRRQLKTPDIPDINSLLSHYHQQDPITVDYGGQHPFERRRKLEDVGPVLGPVAPVNETEYGDRNEMAPIRIRFLTDILEAQRTITSGSDPSIAAQIGTILERILPAAAAEWSTHLSVFPVASAIPVTEESCLGIFTKPELQSYLGTGVEDADLAIIAFGDLCESSTLAYAGPCNRDQFDRPIIGLMGFCLDTLDLDTTGTGDVSDPTLVTVHEIAHALGFISGLTPYFRDAETGEPLTPRTASGAVEPRTVTCVDGSEQTIPFPGENTLRASTTSPGLSGRERLHYELVTPRVATVVRNLFDCQSLSGARFENNPTNPLDCFGSHWDERYFGLELMSPISNREGGVLSPLTLAFFEDSGWYAASYANLGLIASFALGLGCGFVEGDCIVNDQVPDYGEDIFCNTPLDLVEPTSNPIYCDPSHKTLNACSLFDQGDLSPEELPEDPILYFSNPDLVSPIVQHEFCPMPLIYVGLDCTDNTTDVENIFVGETYGSDSRCVNTVIPGFRSVPACLPIQCDEANYRVIIGGRVCEFDFQMHSISIDAFGAPEAMFKCPRLSSVCPDLFGCPGACSGRGVCNYSVTPAQCECFDTADTSASCEASSAAPQPRPTPAPTSGSCHRGVALFGAFVVPFFAFLLWSW